MTNFATMLYKQGSTYNIEGYDVDYIVANSEDKLTQLIKDGWVKTIYETKGDKNAVQGKNEGQKQGQDAKEVTKEQLWAELDTQGVEYDKRWGVERLQGLVNVD